MFPDLSQRAEMVLLSPHSERADHAAEAGEPLVSGQHRTLQSVDGGRASAVGRRAIVTSRRGLIRCPLPSALDWRCRVASRNVPALQCSGTHPAHVSRSCTPEIVREVEE